MRIKIFQINSDKDTEGLKFFDLPETGAPSDIYKKVYHGDVDCEDLEDVYRLFNLNRPPTFQGHSLSVSDVVEVCNENENEKLHNGFYYVKSIGFGECNFDPSKAEDMSGMRVVYKTPRNTPLDIRILDDLDSLQNAVGGLIEPIYSEPEGIVLVGNEEAKLIGMKGNIRIGNGSSIIAGPFFVCGDNGEEFVSLTDEQVKTYMDKYAEPEIISDEEVQNDTGFKIHFF